MDQVKATLDVLIGIVNPVYGLFSGQGVFVVLAKLIGPASNLAGIDWKAFETNLLNLTEDGRKEVEKYVVDQLEVPKVVKEKIVLGEASLENLFDLVSNIRKLIGV